MSKSKSPSFQLFPQDFLSSLDVQMMTAAEIGAYCLLLFNSWIQEEQCYLPNDDKILQTLSKLGKKWSGLVRAKILSKFQTTEDGKLIFNARLLKEYENQQLRKELRSQAGRLGNEKRWHTDRNAIASDRLSSSTSSSTSVRGQAPSLEEAKAHFKSLGHSEAEGEKFWLHHDSNGWFRGKTKIKKWKSAAATWINKMPDFKNNGGGHAISTQRRDFVSL